MDVDLKDTMPRTNRRLLIGLLIGIVGVAFQAFGVLTAMQAAMQELRGMKYYAWAFSTFLIGMVVAIVTAGRITDRHGPAKPLTAGFGLFTVGLIGCMLSPNVAVMLAGRFLQGLGSGAMNLALFVLVAQLFGEKQRSQLMAVLAFLWVLPAFLGPPAAGWIASNFGWRWVFGITLIPVAVCAVTAMSPLWKLERVVPEEQPTPVPMWAGLVLGLAVAALQVAGQAAGNEHHLLALFSGAIGVGGLAWVVPIIMPRGFFVAAAGLPAVIWVRALQSGTFFAAEPFLPLMLTQQRGFSLAGAGLILTVGSIGWTVGSAVQSQTWFRLRRDQIIMLGAVSAALGLGMITLYAWLPDVWFSFALVGWILTGFGMGLSQASTSLAVMGLSDVHEQGRNTSSLQVAEGMGSALLTGLAGTLFSFFHTVPNQAGFVATFGALALLCVLAFWLSSRVGVISNAVAGR